jgi:hypothetical protein
MLFMRLASIANVCTKMFVFNFQCGNFLFAHPEYPTISFQLKAITLHDGQLATSITMLVDMLKAQDQFSALTPFSIVLVKKHF